MIDVKFPFCLCGCHTVKVVPTTPGDKLGTKLTDKRVYIGQCPNCELTTKLCIGNDNDPVDKAWDDLMISEYRMSLIQNGFDGYRKIDSRMYYTFKDDSTKKYWISPVTLDEFTEYYYLPSVEVKDIPISVIYEKWLLRFDLHRLELLSDQDIKKISLFVKIGDRFMKCILTDNY